MKKLALAVIVVALFGLFSSEVFAQCADSDNGLNYNIKGVCTGRPNRYTNEVMQLADQCIPPQNNLNEDLTEYTCGIQGGIETCTPVGFKCEYGCRDGVCLQTPSIQDEPTVTTVSGGSGIYAPPYIVTSQITSQPGQTIPSLCTDSDDGINVVSKGIATGQNGQHEDYCSDNFYVVEYFCDGNTARINTDDPKGNDCRFYNENFVCEDGACRLKKAVCDWEWFPGNGQKIIIDNVKYQCPINAQYCRAETKQCCKWSESTGLFYDCNTPPGYFPKKEVQADPDKTPCGYNFCNIEREICVDYENGVCCPNEMPILCPNGICVNSKASCDESGAKWECEPFARDCEGKTLKTCTEKSLWVTAECKNGCNPVTFLCNEKKSVCSDSDSGSNPFTKGKTYSLSGEIEKIKEDTCKKENLLSEYYCDGNEIREKVYDCDGGCENGTCMKSGDFFKSVFTAFIIFIEGLFGMK